MVAMSIWEQFDWAVDDSSSFEPFVVPSEVFSWLSNVGMSYDWAHDGFPADIDTLEDARKAAFALVRQERFCNGAITTAAKAGTLDDINNLLPEGERLRR